MKASVLILLLLRDVQLSQTALTLNPSPRAGEGFCPLLLPFSCFGRRGWGMRVEFSCTSRITGSFIRSCTQWNQHLFFISRLGDVNGELLELSKSSRIAHFYVA